MFNFKKMDIAGFKTIGLLSAVILFIILLTFGVKHYFTGKIVSDWARISEEKNSQIHTDCLNLIYDYQNKTSEYASVIAKNKKVVNAFLNQNTRKTYEALYDIENTNSYNIELYNSRLELFLFSGRQVNPDILELKRALDGERFSVVKEVGLYSYIIVFEPLKNESGATEGVLVVSSLLDINAQVQNKFYSGSGIKKEIYDKYHIDVILDFSRNQNAALSYDTTSGELTQLGINDINNKKIGKLVIPNLDQSSYVLSVSNKFDNVIGILVFALNILAMYAVILVSQRTKFLIIRVLLTMFVLIVSRYVWLALDFPGKLITEMGSDIFSPIHFASGYAFGTAKSIGELLISSIILLIITIYIVVNVIQYYKNEFSLPASDAGKMKDTGKSKDTDKVKQEMNSTVALWRQIIYVVCSLFVSVYSIHIYGLIIQSLIYNSTIRFIDKSDIFSITQPELIIVRLVITCFSISLLMILISSGIIIIKNINQYVSPFKAIRKNSALFVFAAIILINIIISAFPESFIDISLKFNLRAVVLSLAGLFTLYIQRQLSFQREFRFVNVVNFSFMLLACVIFVPAVLLNKITTQENRYLEKAAKEISMQSNDKISFLISSTLDDVTDSPDIENAITDKNKSAKLAFSIWAGSKFYDEDLNSAVFVLDTAKNLISDFNINSNELLSDSVISFTLRSLNTKNADTLIADTDEEAQMEETAQNENSYKDINTVNKMFQLLQTGEVLQNKEMRFYSSIRPIEKTNLRNGALENVAGYVIVASGYDAKNFLTQTNMGIFKNFTRDNILSKLTSIPVITEFSEGELVGSSNKDVSKSFLKSIDAFRESVKDKVDKSALRYDEFENVIYKSFYVLSDNPAAGGKTEKIYVVSVKVNDFGLSTFYFFRYLLFIVLVYVIILSIYLLYKLLLYISNPDRYKFFKFGFREKLFASFMLASVIPIVILAIYTREFVKDKNEEFYRNQLISDLRIVEQYIKSKASTESPKPNKNSKKEVVPYSDLFDKGFSESDKNFNFYVKTKLAATTNEQLYKSDLLDTRISGNAFYNIALLKRDYFPENQQIGDFTFIVGYKPIYDNFNNLIGIISTQTVFKQSEINQELTESLVYILGPYFTAVIILIFIVNFLSYRISNPVLKLQKATEQLSKGNIDVQVKSNSKDEIGELVKSFNRMIKELKRSRAELKKAEREGAWRDIARQVAHEIKNPLTPMKLAMQHMYYAYTHGSNDFKQIIKSTNKLIIDQIETLNKIATEFSNFAKLPSRNYELLDINEILSDVVKLMNTEGKIHLKTDNDILNKSVNTANRKYILGDKDEVRRALINIIKNSMQAVDENESRKDEGSVEIETIRYNGYYSVKIKDNGVGMDEETQQKLFEPYFSTKSSGMGLGLVITKKILDDMKAKITVNSKPGRGTEVEVRFKMEEMV
jgi:nitrogen fixation/metabolism regulation signal transduction histidine kinase